MYLRTGNLFKSFLIERKKDESVSSRGRVTSGFEKVGTISAVLSETKTNEIERFRQLSHPVTHTIVQSGSPKAQVGDRLIFENRIFIIQGVDNPGSLGLWTIYYAEERKDCGGAGT